MALNSVNTINTTLIVDNTTGLVDPADVRVGLEGAAGLFVQTARTASITLALTDRGTLIPMNVASGACNVTIPTNAAVSFDVGVIIGIRWMGVIAPTFVASGGVTLRLCSPDTATLRALYARAFAQKVGTDEWDVFGQLA